MYWKNHLISIFIQNIIKLKIKMRSNYLSRVTGQRLKKTKYNKNFKL